MERVIFVILILPTAIFATNPPQNVTEINSYVDETIEQLQLKMTSDGTDPLKMGDIREKLISGEKVNLTNGWLRNISSLSRNGDIKINSTSKNITYDLPIGFDILWINYDDSSSNMSESNTVIGKLSNFTLDVQIVYDFNKTEFQFVDTFVKNSGSFSIQISGNDLKKNTVTLWLQGSSIYSVQSLIGVHALFVVGKLNKH